jgi:type IV pilus assembly protein PilX
MNRNSESGAALVVALIMMIVLTLIGLSSTFTSTFEIILSGEKKRSADAFYSAETSANILVLRYLNFVPDRYDYNPYTDTANKNPTNATAEIDFDPLKIGPPKGYSSLSNDYAYFWLRSIGDDSTGVSNRSTSTIEQNVVRVLPKDESITEVKVP